MAVGTQCRTDYRRAAFLPNTIRDWNNLPDECWWSETVNNMNPEGESWATASPSIHLPSLGEYDPQFFLCCHDVVPSEKRIGTKVWSCAFEPSLEYPGETGNILATCGGRTVCFIDVMTGLMMKRFQDNVKKENFYAMAWTTIEDCGKKMNILAVGGRGCRIKLIYPEQLMYYSTITGHKKYINCLMFHPRKPNILFSGSLDGFIIIWDIGKPGAERTFNRTALLKLKTSASIGDPLCLTYDSRGNVLVAVTEKGFVGWRLRKFPLPTAKTAPTFTARIVQDHSYIFAMSKYSSSTAQSRRSRKKRPLRKGQMDCLVTMDYGLVATKCVGGEDILVWSLDDTLSSGAFRKYVKVTEPLLRLVYPEMREKYINMGYVSGVLSVGSDNGTIYLYDVDDMIYAITSPVTMPMKPSEVLEWPEVDGLDDDDDDFKTNGPGGSKEGDGMKLKEKGKETKVVLNMVVMSSDRNVVVAGTDNNLVCIWHRTQD